MSETKKFEVIPDEMAIIVTKGDELGMAVDFSIDLTGYSSWEAIVFKTQRTVSSDFPAGINTQGETAETFTVSVTNASTGILNLALTETQTDGLSVGTLYRWFLRGVAPGAVTRTFISGTFTVRAP
jgi:hypothetical protein